MRDPPSSADHRRSGGGRGSVRFVAWRGSNAGVFDAEDAEGGIGLGARSVGAACALPAHGAAGGSAVACCGRSHADIAHAQVPSPWRAAEGGPNVGSARAFVRPMPESSTRRVAGDERSEPPVASVFAAIVFRIRAARSGGSWTFLRTCDVCAAVAFRVRVARSGGSWAFLRTCDLCAELDQLLGARFARPQPPVGFGERSSSAGDADNRAALRGPPREVGRRSFLSAVNNH